MRTNKAPERFTRYLFGIDHAAVCTPAALIITAIVIAKEMGLLLDISYETLAKAIATAYITATLMALWFERRRAKNAGS